MVRGEHWSKRERECRFTGTLALASPTCGALAKFGTLVADVQAGAKITVSPKTFCTCVFDALSDKQTGIKFSEFKKLNAELQEKPGPLPASFTKAFDGCTKSA